jgi:hypothetical protein
MRWWVVQLVPIKIRFVHKCMWFALGHTGGWTTVLPSLQSKTNENFPPTGRITLKKWAWKPLLCKTFVSLFSVLWFHRIYRGLHNSFDCLCGLVVRVLGYRSGGPGSIPDHYQKKSSGSGTKLHRLSLRTQTMEFSLVLVLAQLFRGAIG